jgi:hypothetical protein
MSTQTATLSKEQLLEEIKNWTSTDKDLEDVIHRYFRKTRLRHWCDVAEEGRAIYEQMFAVEMEEFSPIDDIICGVAAQSSDGMCLSMAAALGWNAGVLGLVLSAWNEPDENGEYKKETVTLEELKALYEATLAEWGALDADH